MFPCGEALAVAAPEARCRNVANAARVAAAALAASGGMSDHFGARAVADQAALHDIGLTIGRNDGLGSAAGTAAVHHSVVAVGQTDNYAAAPDNSSAPAGDSFSVAAIRNSAAAVFDSYAARNNCVPAGAGIAAGVQAGWTLAADAAPGARVVTGWVPGGKDAAENRRDESARGTAPPPELAS
jgi:hypothetical protein